MDRRDFFKIAPVASATALVGEAPDGGLPGFRRKEQTQDYQRPPGPDQAPKAGALLRAGARLLVHRWG